MRLIEARDAYRNRLANVFSTNEIDFYFKSVLRGCLDIDPLDLALKPNLELLPFQQDMINDTLEAFLEEKPLQYILGEIHFRNIALHVNPLVLIPRPETEELVEWIIEDYKGLSREISVVDFGTGSGCIALSLKKEQPFFSVCAVDLDKPILDLVQENAQKNKLQIATLQFDIIELDQLDLEVELIVSNPPYICPSEKKEMKKNVLEYEPHQALFVPENDPLLFYRHILNFASQQLKPKGKIYFEINPRYVVDLEYLILSFSDYRVTKRLDIFGKTRMLRIEKQ